MGPRASVEAPTTVNKHKVDHEETNKAPDDATDYSEKSLQKAKFSDFTRVFAYTSLTDRILLGFAVLGQVGYVVKSLLVKSSRSLLQNLE